MNDNGWKNLADDSVETDHSEFFQQGGRRHFVGRVDRNHMTAYHKGKRWNKHFDLEALLRIHLLQNLYGLPA